MLSGKPVASSLLRSRVLEEGELFLEFTLGEPDSFLWVITREEFRVVKLPSRKQIRRTVRSFLATVASPPRAPGNPFERHIAVAIELFDMLLGPVRQLVLGSRRLIISPDGILHQLPFEALAGGEEQDRFRYLLEIAPLSYVPSASVLAELREWSETDRRSLDFLGVAQPKAQLKRLQPHANQGNGLGLIRMPSIPLAAEEVESVARLFPAGRRRTFIGPEATESAIKQEDLRRFRVLHFATHALADDVFPERSAIFLATDGFSGEDGILRMGEVLSLRLASDLVVLSGCQTGLGQVLSSEGTVGLSWAFLSAGSSSTVVSLWNVNDRSTLELMQAFYHSRERQRKQDLGEGKS